MTERSTEPSKDVLALAMKLTRVSQRLEAIEQQELGKRIIEMSEILQNIAEGMKEKDPGPKAWNWSAMTAEQAATAWDLLLTWRREVLAERWPTAYRTMTTPCWYRHPDVVEDLSALYVMWTWSFTGKDASPLRGIEWVDRWLPYTATRVAQTLKQCSFNGHKEPAKAQDHDDAEISQYLAEELARREAAERR